MTKLLVSVRSAAEAQIACAAGVDLIDIKEPARGPLGAADAATIDTIVRQVAGRRPLSAALGELTEPAVLSAAFAGRVKFAKFGLAGCAALADWQERWQVAIQRLPQEVAPVAVAYADWQSARAPDPRQVLAAAERAGCAAVLVDTYDKSRGPLTEWLGRDELRDFISAVQERGMLSVVAGGLNLDQISTIVRLRPDYVGVRGAACNGDRIGELDSRRTAHLVSLVRTATEHSPSICESTEHFSQPALAKTRSPLHD